MTTPNAELAYRVLDHIDAHPDQHDQHVWIERVMSGGKDCGTAACLAGWACLLSGDTPVFGDESEIGTCEVSTGRTYESVPERAAELLGIPYEMRSGAGHPLFHQENTREDLGRLIPEVFGPRPERAS